MNFYTESDVKAAAREQLRQIKEAFAAGYLAAIGRAMTQDDVIAINRFLSAYLTPGCFDSQPKPSFNYVAQKFE